MILDINNPKKLHLIDCWSSKRYSLDKRKKVENKIANKIKENVVEIHIDMSTQAAKSFNDFYFDWIYIDTDHSYETTFLELESYRNKVKENGIIAGHDYILGNWNNFIRYGVIEAVNEFCVKYSWEVIFLTTELNISPSFAIRKITNDDTR
ncbi:MAG: class I SAM-dependent methyltransferase [Bacteroidetes bacterium]|nr:class I SAM-dependent methyltransferase [Bacteroidota bacterium]